jgi:hypothetical protein
MKNKFVLSDSSISPKTADVRQTQRTGTQRLMHE